MKHVTENMQTASVKLVQVVGFLFIFTCHHQLSPTHI